MNICVYGAGAIGTLFASFLSKRNKVICIARKPQVDAVKRYGITISGKTSFQGSIPYFQSLQDMNGSPDLILLTVKAFDTEKAAKDIAEYISEDIPVLSLQNGLNNCDVLLSYLTESQILAGITSHGALFMQPGVIKHTGIGKTCIGELDGKLSKRLRDFQVLCIKSGLSVAMSTNIKKDIWRKGIVNASINPLTAIFQCPNGYLLENPLLHDLVVRICEESTMIAQKNDVELTVQDMFEYTFEVIQDTKENHSSMLQSIRQKKRTEIDAINGTLRSLGKNTDTSVFFNELLTKVIHFMYG